MPRRQAVAQVHAEDEEGEIQEDGEMAVDSERPTQEGLRLRAQEYLDMTEQIKDLSGQTNLLRKALKATEKNLFSAMVLLNVEDLEINGTKISRVKKLQTSEN